MVFFSALTGPNEGDPAAGQDGGDSGASRVAEPQRRAVDQGENTQYNKQTIRAETCRFMCVFVHVRLDL